MGTERQNPFGAENAPLLPLSLLLQAASSPNCESSCHWCWDPAARRCQCAEEREGATGASKDSLTHKCPFP